MLKNIRSLHKEYNKTIYYLSKIYKDEKLVNILKFISLLNKLKNKKKKTKWLLRVKKLYYREVLKTEMKVKLDKRLPFTNIYIKLRWKRDKGTIYRLYKGNTKRQRINRFDLVSKNNILRYKAIFSSVFENKKARKKIKKIYETKNYEKFFVWPFIITIKKKILIFKNIFFKNFFLLRLENTFEKIYSWVELKNKFKSSELLLNNINTLNINMLNNYFIKNKPFLYNNNKNLKLYKKNIYKSDFFKLYLNNFFLKNINNLENFLKMVKKLKIKITSIFFFLLIKNLLSILRNKNYYRKKFNNSKMNIYCWNKNNKVFNKTFSLKKNIFWKYKKYVKKYAKRSLINYSFFLRLYMLYFFWFLFFFNKIFYYFNKILFNFWFRFFYFLNSSFKFNSKIFFNFKKLYKNISFSNKNINFYFEFENIFINYLDNIKNVFFTSKNYIFTSKNYILFLKNFIINDFYFLFKNYFFNNIFYFYNTFLKNIVNKTFNLENNLFDLLYCENYNYNNIYNKDYFLINGSICKKYNYFYTKVEKKDKNSKDIDWINTIRLQEKRKKTLFLY